MLQATANGSIINLNYSMRFLTCSALLLAALGLGLSGCSGTTLGHFDTEETLPESRVEGSAVASILPAVLPSLALDVTSTDSFESEQFDFLTSIQVDSLRLDITDSSTDQSEDTLEDGIADNFDFLASIEIYIQTETDGETRQELIGSIPESDPQLSASAQSISFTMTGVDILDFVESDAGYEIQIQASGESPRDAVIFDGEVTYRVGVGFR